MPSRTLVGPAGVKLKCAPEDTRSWSPLGRPWLFVLLLGCWAAGLLAPGLLRTENWGPLAAHRACPTNQPASVPRAQLLFRMIDDFVRVLGWASIALLARFSVCVACHACLHSQGLLYACSSLVSLSSHHSSSFPKLCLALPNRWPFFLICADTTSDHPTSIFFRSLCPYFFCPPPGPSFRYCPGLGYLVTQSLAHQPRPRTEQNDNNTHRDSSITAGPLFHRNMCSDPAQAMF